MFQPWNLSTICCFPNFSVTYFSPQFTGGLWDWWRKQNVSEIYHPSFWLMSQVLTSLSVWSHHGECLRRRLQSPPTKPYFIPRYYSTDLTACSPHSIKTYKVGYSSPPRNDPHSLHLSFLCEFTLMGKSELKLIWHPMVPWGLFRITAPALVLVFIPCNALEKTTNSHDALYKSWQFWHHLIQIC